MLHATRHALQIITCRREVKRRHDEAYEYEEPRTAKRAAAAAGAGARPRFGIRPPAVAAAMAAANPVSESEVGLRWAAGQAGCVGA